MSLHLIVLRDFLITFGCVARGQQAGGCRRVDGLYQHAFLPVG